MNKLLEKGNKILLLHTRAMIIEERTVEELYKKDFYGVKLHILRLDNNTQFSLTKENIKEGNKRRYITRFSANKIIIDPNITHLVPRIVKETMVRRLQEFYRTKMKQDAYKEEGIYGAILFPEPMTPQQIKHNVDKILLKYKVNNIFK